MVFMVVSVAMHLVHLEVPALLVAQPLIMQPVVAEDGEVIQI
jgi:hypothetical protein